MTELDRSRWLAWTALAAAMALSATLVWVWGSGLTLIDDEWGYAVRTATQPMLTYLFNPPPGKHLIAVPLLLYAGAFRAFGIASDVPYQLAHIALLLLCAGLFYTLARRRVGDLLALFPTTILLFLGPAREVVATPLRIPSLISTAAGLGMLLSLERQDRKGDVLACVLLAISLASLSTGYPFAAAAAVLVLARPSPQRWRRSWVFLVPVGLYALWWTLEFSLGPNAHPVGSTVLGLPVYLGKSLAVTVLSITGLVSTDVSGELNYPLALYVVVGCLLIVGLAAAIILRLRRPGRLSPFLVAVAAALVVFWTATAFAPGPERVPWASRYLYLDALLILLFLVELARELDLPRRLTAASFAALVLVFAIALAGNIRELRTETRSLVQESDYLRAGLTSLEMARGTVAPTFVLRDVLAPAAPTREGLLGEELENGGVPIGPIPASGFFSVLDRYGSPAYTPEDLASRPPPVRAAADAVLAGALGLDLRPASNGHSAQGPAPRPLSASGRRVSSPRPGCVELSGSSGGVPAVLALRSAGVVVRAAPGPPVPISVGRFADDTPVSLGWVEGGHGVRLRIPPDSGFVRSPLAWRVGIAARQGVVACGVGKPVTGSA